MSPVPLGETASRETPRWVFFASLRRLTIETTRNSVLTNTYFLRDFSNVSRPSGSGYRAIPKNGIDCYVPETISWAKWRIHAIYFSVWPVENGRKTADGVRSSHTTSTGYFKIHTRDIRLHNSDSYDIRKHSNRVIFAQQCQIKLLFDTHIRSRLCVQNPSMLFTLKIR